MSSTGQSESSASPSVPSIETDLCGNRFSLEYLSAIIGAEIIEFAHVPTTVCVQAGSHSAILRLKTRNASSQIDIFVKKVIDLDYSHKSWVDRKRLLKYIRNEARFYKEFYDSIQGSGKCIPRCLAVMQHNLETLDDQDKEPEADEKLATGAILFLEPIPVSPEGYYQTSPLTFDEISQSLRALAAFHAKCWEKVDILSFIFRLSTFRRRHRKMSLPKKLLCADATMSKVFVSPLEAINEHCKYEKEVLSKS